MTSTEAGLCLTVLGVAAAAAQLEFAGILVVFGLVLVVLDNT